MYEWQKSHQELFSETDLAQLKLKIEAAEVAIVARLQQLYGNSDHTDERAQIANALHTIRALQVEKLGFPKMASEL